MGFFKKLLTSVGIGGAKVDTVISNPDVKIGEDIEGVVNIIGGSVEQNINKVEIELKTEYVKLVEKEIEGKEEKEIHEELWKATLATLVVDSDIVIGANEKKEISFTFRIPDYAPISLDRKIVWLQTSLDIPLALDPEDRDYINVVPNDSMAIILDALIRGLGLKTIEVENSAGYVRGRQGEFLQEFKFVPQSALSDILDEVIISFLPNPEGIEIFAQMDRKVRDFKSLVEEVSGLDEKSILFNISHEDVEKGSEYVAQVIKLTIEENC